MRLLFAAVSDFKPRVGGVAELTHNLASALANRGNDVVVAARPQDGDATYDASAPFEVRRIPPAERDTGLQRLANEFHPDAIVINVLGGGWGAARKVTRRLDVPLILLVHGQEITPGGKLLPRIKTWFALHSSDAVIANSAYTMNLAIAGGAVAARCRVVNPGVDLHADEGTVTIPNELDASLRGRTVILSLSRLIRRKGFDTAIRALAPLLKTRDELVYVIAGGGAMETELRAFSSSLELDGKVLFTGPVDEETKRYLLKRQTLFLMPNRDLPNGDVEGFGIVFLEANAAGKPVIGGMAGGVPDAIEEGRSGLLVDPEDQEAIRNAVARLVSEPETAEKMGRYGRERALSRFSWDSRAEAFEGVVAVAISSGSESR